MSLPEYLRNRIESLLEGVSLKELQKGVLELSNRYREGADLLITKHIHRLAYLSYRFPATIEVMKYVFEKIPESNKSYSLLDFGAGMGAARFLGFDCVTLVEQDKELIDLGKKLIEGSLDIKESEMEEVFIANEVTWYHKNVTRQLDIKEHDIVMSSYILGELENIEPLLENADKLSSKYLVFIEPGTPKGFKKIHEAREYFLKKGYSIVAPCTHTSACPMYEKGDWCHFYTRVERSRVHRIIKNAKFGYEDEKFSYLIVSKEDFKNDGYRVLRFPSKQKGYISFELCGREGIREFKALKRNKDKFKKVQKKSWGSFLSLDEV